MLTAVFALFAAAQERPDLVLSGEPLPPGAVARFGIPHSRLPETYYPFAAGYSDEGSFRVAVSDGKDARVWTWHAPSAQPPKHLFRGHPADVTRLALSDDARTLATGDKGGDLRVWDLATGEELLALEDEPADGALAVGPRGRLVFRAGATGCAVWDTATKKRLAVGEEKRSFVAAAFSPDGKLLVTADKKGNLEVWEPRALKRVGELAWAPPIPPPREKGAFRLPDLGFGVGLFHVVDPPSPEHDGGVRRVFFTADGTRVFAAGASVVRAWEVESRKELWRESHSRYFTNVGNATAWSFDHGKLTGAAVSPDGKFVATADVSGTVHLLDGATGKDLWAKHNVSAYHQHNPVLGVAFHPNGKWLAAHAAGNCVDLWDVRTGARLAATGGHVGAAGGLAFSPDGKYLAGLGRDDFFIDVYDVATHRTVARAPAPARGHGNGFGFTANGKYIVTGSTYYRAFTVTEFAPGTREPLRTFHERGAYGYADVVCIDPRAPARFLTAGSGQVIYGQDIPGTKWIDYAENDKSYIRLSEAPYQIALAADANRLVVGSGSYGKRAQVFDLKTGKQPVTLEDEAAAYGVAVTPDGKLIAATGKVGQGGPAKRQLRVWDGDTGKRKFMIDFGDEGHGSPPAFTPDGKHVAIGIGDEVVLVDVATGKEVVRVKAHHGTVWRIAFSPDGKRMASCGDDGQTLLWDVAKLPAKP